MTSRPHQAKKRFGQNFLHDKHIVDRIVSAIAPQDGQQIIEIGPGQGALTSPLLVEHPQLTAIEIDRDLIAGLKTRFAHYPDFNLLEGDALQMDYGALAKTHYALRLVGNLPYNLSTPLMFHLLSFGNLIKDMHFMLQKEVVDRLSAKPGSKAYGRLSVMVQLRSAVQPLFLVPPTAFKPAPKVESMVVRLTPHKDPAHSVTNVVLFDNVVNRCFQQRRKTLRNCLKTFLDPEKMRELDMSLAVRPDTLSVEDFVTLSNRIHSLT